MILNMCFMACSTFTFFSRMPLTNSERQKKWRERKAKEVGEGVCREKDNERWKKRRHEIKKNKQNDIKFKEKQRERKVKSRAKKNDLENDIEIFTYESAFSSIASRKRSVRRAKNSLPQNINQKREVVKILFAETIDATPGKMRMINHWMNSDNRNRTSNTYGRPPNITNEIAQKLKTFLDCTDISYTLPGRDNQVYMGKINGEKIFQPKKYILYTYNQLHSLIKKNDDPDLANLKFSTTYRYIRDNKDYVGYSKIPHINCLCPECENICLFVQGINKALSNNNNENLSENCHDLIEKISFQPITKLCAENSCPNCPYPEETFEFLNDIELVTFLEWTKIKYYEKKPTFCSGDEAAINLRDKLKKLKQHYYIKRIQSQEYLHKNKQFSWK